MPRPPVHPPCPQPQEEPSSSTTEAEKVVEEKSETMKKPQPQAKVEPLPEEPHTAVGPAQTR